MVEMESKQLCIIYCQKKWGGAFKPTVELCIPCHKQIHALYTNDEIATRLTTIRQLKQDEKLASFIKWIRKQPAGKLMKIRKSNELKQKGR